MSDSLPELLHAARAWFDAASAAGWLDDAARAKLDAVEAACPGDLFAHGARPLVVAFFGGTGVGKSSLLNRLAGTRLARTGAERPTSRELTIYLHESVPLANLPESLPADKVQVQRHASAALREVVWIDTPDVDSTAAENRALALACLPHVDLVVYVVSPERYRDDVGWRVLRERGHRHGWMFAMNRWDEGDPKQRDDLGRMLREAGFENPLIFRTACPPRPPAFLVADEFEDLKAAIGELVSQHGVAELERLGHAARLAELRAAIEGAAAALGDDVTWAKLHANLDAHLQRARVALIEGAAWPIATAAANFASGDASLLRSVVRTARNALREDGAGVRGLSRGAARDAGGDAAEKTHARGLWVSLWDDWAASRMAECVDALEIDLRRARVAPGPTRGRLEAALAGGEALVDRPVNDALRAALATPGTALQRAARQVTGFLTVLLPGMALLLVAWRVIEGYLGAAQAGGRYLDSSFAVHSVLFVLVAWLVPFGLDRWLKPSLVAAAAGGMRSGFELGLEQLGEELRAGLVEAERSAEQMRGDARRLCERVGVATPVGLGANRESSVGRVVRRSTPEFTVR
ncbi:MAG: GTPase [Phycisphaerae bacterium]